MFRGTEPTPVPCMYMHVCTLYVLRMDVLYHILPISTCQSVLKVKINGRCTSTYSECTHLVWIMLIRTRSIACPMQGIKWDNNKYNIHKEKEKEKEGERLIEPSGCNATKILYLRIIMADLNWKASQGAIGLDEIKGWSDPEKVNAIGP